MKARNNFVIKKQISGPPVGAENQLLRDLLEEVAHVVGVCVEVGVGGPGICLHTGQAGGDLRLLIAGVSSLTSLGQQTVGELQRQPAMMILTSDMSCQAQCRN